jgi:hypothetical protein
MELRAVGGGDICPLVCVFKVVTPELNDKDVFSHIDETSVLSTPVGSCASNTFKTHFWMCLFRILAGRLPWVKYILWLSRVSSDRPRLLPSRSFGGRAIAQAVSRRLPTAAARVRCQVMWDLWWIKWPWGRFFPSTSVSPATFHSTDCFTLISGPGTIGETVADLPSGLSLTLSQETKIKRT